MSWFKKNSRFTVWNTRLFTRFIVKDKIKTDGNDTEIENLPITEFQECDDATESAQDSCYSWSGVS